MTNLKRFSLLALFVILMIAGSCEGPPEEPYRIPAHCFTLVGEPIWHVNDTLQVRDAFPWQGNVEFAGRWIIDMQNSKYWMLFSKGTDAIMEDELDTLSNDNFKKLVEQRGSHSLKEPIDHVRLLFFVKKPEPDILLGEKQSEIMEGDVSIKTETIEDCDLYILTLNCVMGSDPQHKYRINVSFKSAYHFK